MKFTRCFIGIILVFFLCVSTGFAQMTAEEKDTLLADINDAQTYENIYAVIESERLDTLGEELFGYIGGCSNTAKAAEFIMRNRPFQDISDLAKNYVFSSIVNENDFALIKEYCDNGLLFYICGADEYPYQHSALRDEIVKCVCTSSYNSIEEFSAALDAAYQAMKNTGGSSSSGSTACEAILLDKGGLPAKNAAEVSKLRYLDGSYSGTLITAVYDSFGRMKSLKTVDADAENKYVDIPLNTADGDSVKAMLWESLDEMSPVTEAITINADENEERTEYTEGIVVSANDFQLEIEIGNERKLFLPLSGEMYGYLGHWVEITSVGAYILDIKDSQSHDTVTLSCNHINSISAFEISSGETDYSISPTARFFDNGYETQFYVPDAPYEIVLSKPANSSKWDTVTVLSYTSDVIAYIDAESYYTENGGRYEIGRTPIVSDGEIKIGSVISYCNFKAYISNETVYGKAEFTDEKVKIGEKTFDIYNNVDINTNYDMYTAYLDVFGNVVKLVPDQSVYDTRIITKVYNADGKTYADIVGGEKLLIDGEVIYCGLRISSEELPYAAANSGFLYAKILDGSEKKVIITEGEMMQMRYSDGMLSSDKAVVEYGTPMCLYSGEKYMTCVLEKGILNNSAIYQCTVFFDEDNKINPVYVCVKATEEKLIIITDVDSDNGIISGYCDGKYVTFQCSVASSDDIFACVRAKCIGNEIISYTNSGFIYNDAVGWVIKKGNGYIACGNPEQYEIIKISDDASIYLYDGNSLIPAGFSDIVEDSRISGYGSYVRYILKSGNNAKIIVLDK